jgi:hypothetical protein
MSSGKHGARTGCPFSYGSGRAPIVWRGAAGSAPRTVATRAIEIDAPPSPIWTWLVQMGPGRVGAYTYDWIENLFGLNMLSADRIVPEWPPLQGATCCTARRADRGCEWRSSRPSAFSRTAPRSAIWVWAFVIGPAEHHPEGRAQPPAAGGRVLTSPPSTRGRYSSASPSAARRAASSSEATRMWAPEPTPKVQ